ncbi:MAG: hypothetical protein DMF70_05765 [Acidobacteria bacterium]|nr:MAG: hypothetical protein DMF70_05765 [Acidobacteriota bacterium]
MPKIAAREPAAQCAACVAVRDIRQDSSERSPTLGPHESAGNLVYEMRRLCAVIKSDEANSYRGVRIQKL